MWILRPEVHEKDNINICPTKPAVYLHSAELQIWLPKVWSLLKCLVLSISGGFSELLSLCLSPSSSVFRPSQTLVFQCTLLTAVAGASHLICHLLLYDNWSNWTFCPRNVTGNLVAISPSQPHGGHISETLGGKWRAGISFIEKPRWLVGILTSHPPLVWPGHLRCLAARIGTDRDRGRLWHFN